MIAEFDLTLDDHLAFQEYHLKHSPSIRALRLKNWLALPAGLGLLYGFMLMVSPNPSLAVKGHWPLIAVGVVWLMGFPFWFHKAMLRNVRTLLEEGSNKGMLGKHTITISPETITQAMRYQTSAVRWEAVDKVVRGEGYLFVYISAVNAYIIPEHAFDGEKAFFDFCGQAIDYFSKVKN